MPEVEVTYSEVKFTKSVPKGFVFFSLTDTTYAEVQISKQEDTKDLSIHDVQQPDRKSKMSPAVLVVLISLVVLLAAAASGLGLKKFYPTSPPPATCPSCPATPSSPTSGTTEPLLPTSPPSTSPPSTSPPSICVNEKAINYYFSTTKSSWTDSRRSCADLGSDLVKIDSREEQMFLDNRLRGLMEDSEDMFWIGLTDSVEEGRWFWVDGSALNQSLNFWVDTPDDWKGPDQQHPEGEDCATMGRKEVPPDLNCWADIFCFSSQRSICEKTPETGQMFCV
uniref:C-type lectin domain-containing protein n=1 Tax=Poecilia formosa TaxID=48698 RepID=A0A096MDZ4_POEFO